jgi:SAM-dependent methyltransferase
MDAHTRTNQTIWDAWTSGDQSTDHARDEARVAAGGSSLRPIELAEVGEVSGKTLLHLLCNRGSDTVSWARLGATVTGVDFSGECIARAEALAEATAQPARFLHSDLYALPEVLDEQFDIVFMSYGVLCWMPDLRRWAEICAGYLRPGGILYLVEIHPFAGFLVPEEMPEEMKESSSLGLNVAYPFFHSATARLETVSVPSADKESHSTTLSVWSYSLGEVVTALASTGLQVEFLHEHAATFYRQLPMLVEDGSGLWRWPDPETAVPLLFSLRARRSPSP